ncbi:VWA domain-containing protein [Chryseobacterium sp. A301]
MFDLNFQWESPWMLLLFLFFVPLLIRDFSKKNSQQLRVSSLEDMDSSKGYGLVLKFLKLSKYLILSLLFLAMARPRTFSISELQDDTKGMDIMLTVDASLSMLSKDLEPDRLSALQKIASQFVKDRPTDRIGLVTYSGEALTKVPVTSDHQIVLDEIEQIDPMELEPGTAIGDGLSVAATHLRHSKAKTKIIILMTDGVNTIENSISPLVAADLAQSLGIKVYTIGIGTNGYALMPTNIDIFGDLVFTEVEVKIDEPTLLDIARKTGGKYFRATSNDALQNVYAQINQLEKSEVKTSKMYNYTEYFRYLLLGALLILLVDALLRWALFKTIL